LYPCQVERTCSYAEFNCGDLEDIAPSSVLAEDEAGSVEKCCKVSEKQATGGY
jgi:hypothetical protein